MITDPTRLLQEGYEHDIQCAGHLERGLDPDLRRQTVEDVIRILRPLDFDAIAFRGLSGALIAPTVAMLMGKTLLAVRKPEEQRHSYRMVEGDYAARRYVIIDDMVSSGDTLRAIWSEINRVMPHAECIGHLPYMWVTCRSDHRAVEPLTSSYRRATRHVPSWREL